MDLTPFEDAGIYDPGAPDAEDVRATIEYLASLGVDVDTMLAGFRDNWIHSAGLDLLLARGTMSARDVSEKVRIPLEEVLDTYRLLGVHIDDPDERILLDEEVELIEILFVAEQIFEEGEAEQILRTASGALASVAESVVSVFVGGVEDRLEAAQRMTTSERTALTQATAQQALDFGRALGLFFRHHLREAITRQRASMLGASDRRLRTMTIGFVDLVGFTRLSSSMSAAELVAFISDFESRSYDIATRAGGRLVKIIGDEVMVSALDVDTGCRIVLDMIDEFRTADTAPRAGVASGEVVARLGDFFGPVVNLASRLVDEAVPGEVLAEDSIARQLGGEYRCEPAGRRMLKGFSAPVRVVSVTRC